MFFWYFGSLTVNLKKNSYRIRSFSHCFDSETKTIYLFSQMLQHFSNLFRETNFGQIRLLCWVMWRSCRVYIFRLYIHIEIFYFYDFFFVEINHNGAQCLFKPGSDTFSHTIKAITENCAHTSSNFYLKCLSVQKCCWVGLTNMLLPLKMKYELITRDDLPFILCCMYSKWDVHHSYANEGQWDRSVFGQMFERSNDFVQFTL